jgi:hypothetical protein
MEWRVLFAGGFLVALKFLLSLGALWSIRKSGHSISEKSGPSKI